MIENPKRPTGCVTLTLSPQEGVFVGDEIYVRFNEIYKMGVNGGTQQVRISIIAPKDVPIHRDTVREQNAKLL